MPQTLNITALKVSEIEQNREKSKVPFHQLNLTHTLNQSQLFKLF